MSCRRSCEVFVRKNFWIEWRVVAKIFPLKSLTVDFILLSKLISLRRVKSIELTHRLSSESFPVDKKKDAANKLRLQQTVNLRDREIGFSRSSRHCDHHVVFPAHDRLFDGKNAVALIWPKSSDLLSWGVQQVGPCCCDIVSEPRLESVRRVKIDYGSGYQFLGACINVPDQ